MSDPKGAPAPEAVAAYLRAHPEFLQLHPELAASLAVPRESGAATSLTAYQLDVLRDKNRELSRRLQELYATAQENERLTLRTQQLTLALLRAGSPLAALQAMVASLIEDFHSDLVRVVLIAQTFELPDAEWLIERPPQAPELVQFAEFLRGSEPLCGRLAPQKMDFLFGAQAAQVQSCALIQLPARGLLAIGSREPNRFYPGMGTLFLRMMGEALAAALSRHPA
jgi:uncharacterized protein YigA (DUF484 family)